MIPVKGIIVLIAAVISGLGAIANALWGPRAQARKRLDAGRRTTIADREIVTLTGTVRSAGELLDAPLSGKRCVLYRSVGRLYSNNSSAGQVIVQKLIAFDLETAEGVVRVEGENADVELPQDPIIPRKLEREREFLVTHGYSADAVRGAGFDEVALEPGMKVRVQGMAIVELDPAAPQERGFRDDAPRRIRLTEHDGHPLTIGRPRR